MSPLIGMHIGRILIPFPRLKPFHPDIMAIGEFNPVLPRTKIEPFFNPRYSCKENWYSELKSKNFFSKNLREFIYKKANLKRDVFIKKGV